MLPFPPLLSLRLPQISPFPAIFTPPRPKPYQNPRSRHRRPLSFALVGEDPVIGDCLVFEDGAFEDGAFDDDRDPSPVLDRPQRRAAEVSPEFLVPERWKEAAAGINLTKKEKRRIAHELRSGSKIERRRMAPMPDLEEYRAYREMKLAQLSPVVLDEPQGFAPVKEAEAPSREGRVAPRNPRLGLGGKGMEDVAEFFGSGYCPPEEVDDGKKKQGKRKLFAKEEKVLLNKRIPNLAEATSSKWLPLHTLAASGEFYILDMLLRHNIDINAVDKDGLSAIHKAIICKKQAIVNYLLRNSANPFVRDKDGATLIHYAVQTASSQTIKILLLYNVDINLSDNDGWTPLHLAVQTQRTDIVRLLMIKGADRTLKNQDGLTPLDLCLYSGHSSRAYELIKLLKDLTISKSLS